MRFLRNALNVMLTLGSISQRWCDKGRQRKVRATCPWSSASLCGLSAAGFGATQWAEATAAPGPNTETVLNNFKLLVSPVTASHVRRKRSNPYVPWSEESAKARAPKCSSYLRPATLDLSDASFRWRSATQRCSISFLTICCRWKSLPIVLLPVLQEIPDPFWETKCEGHLQRLLVWSVWSRRRKGGDGHWEVAVAAR